MFAVLTDRRHLESAVGPATDNWVVAKCFFCFADAKLTRAHLLHALFRDAVGAAPDKRTYLGGSSVSTAGIYRSMTYNGDIRQSKVTSLCGDCNARWMQDIEIAAAPAFAELVAGDRIPAPPDLLALSHWAVVFGALASELYPPIQIPTAHRRVIRAATGLPSQFSTFYVWTSDRLLTLQTDLYRGVSTNADDEVVWVSVLQIGNSAIISTTPDVHGRLARVLAENEITSVLGFIGETYVYVPEGFDAAMTTGPRPTHAAVHDLTPLIISAGHPGFIEAPNGRQMLDLSVGLQHVTTDRSFDYGKQLYDYRELRGATSG